MLQTSARAAALAVLLLLGLIPVATALATTPPNTWTSTGAMATARVGLTSTLLPNGKVLVVGGGTTSAELYDPSTGVWTPTGSLSAARSGPTATLLPGGQVLGVVAEDLEHARAGPRSACGRARPGMAGHRS